MLPMREGERHITDFAQTTHCSEFVTRSKVVTRQERNQGNAMGKEQKSWRRSLVVIRKPTFFPASES